MEDALVVLESDEQGRELLIEAAELAAGVDANLHVLSLLSHEEFEEKREALDAMAEGENTSYDDGVFMDNVLAGRIGQAESEADRVLEAAADNNADHVFITGSQRSPTGKAVFGDRAQAVMLNFDGPVTSLLG